MSDQVKWQPRRTFPISEIEPGLFIGHEGDSSNISTLTEKNIGAMVSLSDAKTARWSMPPNRKLIPKNRHAYIPALDTSTQDLLARLSDICDFIERMRSTNSETGESGHNVLVHCTAGISRSATIVLAYLMRKRREPFDTVLASVRQIRRVKPNPNFVDQLNVWAEVDYELWEDEAKTVPKPPYAAYLERRAEALKAKGLTGNEPTWAWAFPESAHLPPSQPEIPT